MVKSPPGAGDEVISVVEDKITSLSSLEMLLYFVAMNDKSDTCSYAAANR
jgi:hypothetical protein